MVAVDLDAPREAENLVLKCERRAMNTSRKKRTSKAIALIASLTLIFGLLPLTALAANGDERVTVLLKAGSSQSNSEQAKTVPHDPYDHAKFSRVTQEYGSNTVYIQCEWEQQSSTGDTQMCQFHEWPLLVLDRSDAYYDDQPKEAYFYWREMKDYPNGKTTQGFPSDFAEWDGTFTYTGINGTVEYGPTNEAPIGEGTYYVYAKVRIPSAVTVLSDGTFILGKTFTIEPSGYKVKFDANVPNSASTELNPLTSMPEMYFKSRVETQPLPPNQFDLPGYKFDHWNTKEDDSGVRYENNAYVKDLSFAGKDVTLYARWKPKEYTITYDPNDSSIGGSVTDENKAVFDQPGTLKPVSAMGWNYGSRKFLGWKVEDLSVLLDDKENFVNLCGKPGYGGDPKDVTLTAQWVESGQIRVITTVDGKPENIASSMTISQVGSSSTTPIPLYADPEGEYFASLAAIPAGNYRLEMVSDKFSIPADKQLLGNLSSDSAVSVVLDYYTASVKTDDHVTSASIRENGTSDPKTEMMVADDTQALISAAVEDGYHFDGYSVLGVTPGNADNTGEFDPAKAGQTITVRGKAEITAHAAANVYSVQFDANTNAAVIGQMEKQDMVYDEPQNLFANQFIRSDATFTGWNTKADGSGTAYADGQSVKNLTAENGGKITLYAQWEETPVKTGLLTFDLGGGTLDGQTGSITISANVGDVIEIPAAPTREGCTFKYWKGSQYNPGDKYTVEGDHTFTAVWEEAPAPIEKATLTFDLAGGTLDGKTGTITIEANVGDVIEIPKAPTREGYTFKYWKGSEYHPGDKYTVEGDHTFTAEWKKSTNAAAAKGSSPKTGDMFGTPFAALAATAACALCLAAIAMLKIRRRSLKEDGFSAR